MSDKLPVISIVCPFFNEEDGVSLFLKETSRVLNEIQKPFEIVAVNDGSEDSTLEKLFNAKEEYPELRVINLSRNFGKEAALTAGLDSAKGEVIIPIDADLQNPPELIKEFIVQWQKGFDVVLAKRNNRASENITKRIPAKLFYKFHNTISNTKIPEDVGDFRLMTRKVVNSIRKLPENQRFMKGIFAWVGFRTTTIEYNHVKREAGKTSFQGRKLLDLAIDDLTSFSIIPLRIWISIGSVIALISFFYGSFIILRTLVLGIDLPGYASMVTMVLFLGGIQLISIGVLGEYVGRIYKEVKQRPSYIIENEY
ncbi:MAG: glycosyltransferase family 2 protein [Melioribacteraceae bacterium]